LGQKNLKKNQSSTLEVPLRAKKAQIELDQKFPLSPGLKIQLFLLFFFFQKIKNAVSPDDGPFIGPAVEIRGKKYIYIFLFSKG